MRGSIRRAKLLGKSRSLIRGGRSRVVVTMQVRLYFRVSPPHAPSPPSPPLPSPPKFLLREWTQELEPPL